MEIWPIYYYVITTVVLFVAMFAYLKLAPRLSLFDTPNERSSHSTITIRGGGVIFLIALILYLILSAGNNLVIVTLSLLLGVLSFADDLYDLSAKFRLLVHFIAVMSVMSYLGLLTMNWWTPIILFFFIWMMNAYNFMDGINGITFANTLSHILALMWVSFVAGILEMNLLLMLLTGTLIFGIFNFRNKALCFLGDVGSIPLGFLLVSLTLMVVISTDSIDPLTFFALYMIDSGWTIAQRLWQGENIMKPHRKHLYQVLANEFKIPHLFVSTVYFLIQMCVNASYFLWNDSLQPGVFFLVIISILSVLYILVKWWLIKVSKL